VFIFPGEEVDLLEQLVLMVLQLTHGDAPAAAAVGPAAAPAVATAAAAGSGGGLVGMVLPKPYLLMLLIAVTSLQAERR
jgi:hypothetical protein